MAENPPPRPAVGGSQPTGLQLHDVAGTGRAIREDPADSGGGQNRTRPLPTTEKGPREARWVTTLQCVLLWYA